jgi:hypothetical protein
LVHQIEQWDDIAIEEEIDIPRRIVAITLWCEAMWERRLVLDCRAHRKLLSTGIATMLTDTRAVLVGGES